MQTDVSYGKERVSGFRADSISQLITAGPKNTRLLVSRVRRDTPGHGYVSPSRMDAAFAVLLQLREQTYRELFVGEKCIHRGSYAARTTSVVNHLEQPTANLLSPFDNLIFVVPQVALDEIAEERHAPRITLNCTPGGVLDETIWHLGNALLPALERPHEVSVSYAEQIMLAANTYFAHVFGKLMLSPQRIGVLAPWQLKRAVDVMMAQLGDDPALKDIAAECGLSLSYFIRAFKTSTGDPPHRWMLRQRIERAKTLMRNRDLSLAEVADACGFADQSHLTRVFKAFVGVAPGAWRRDAAAV